MGKHGFGGAALFRTVDSDTLKLDGLDASRGV